MTTNEENLAFIRSLVFLLEKHNNELATDLLRHVAKRNEKHSHVDGFAVLIRSLAILSGLEALVAAAEVVAEQRLEALGDVH